jgi:hypothetical protein
MTTLLLASMLVLGSYQNPDCNTGNILILEDHAPDQFTMRDLRDCRVDEVEFEATLTREQVQELDAMFSSIVGPMSACDDGVDCAQKIKDTCAEKYSATTTKVRFDAGSLTPCEGECSNGKVISIRCVRKKAPTPPPTTGTKQTKGEER